MNAELQTQLHRLNSDFCRVTGKRFDHFFCPILYQDVAAELVHGHIIPQAFAQSTRATIVQRKDVDNFYGHFEEKFQQIQFVSRPFEQNFRSNSRLLRPKLTLEGKEIEWYRYDGKFQIPSNHTLIAKNEEGQIVPWRVIKMSPGDFDAVHERVEIVTEADFSYEALISSLKAAHLTLFKHLGYQYVAGNSGVFLGWQILGMFFEKSKHLDKGSEDFKRVTEDHFRPYINMLRPVEQLEIPVTIKGTASDRTFFVCWDENGNPWALHVFVKFGRMLKSVLIPSDNGNAALYNQLLRSEVEFPMVVSIAQFDDPGFVVDTRRFELNWVAHGFDQRPKIPLKDLGD